MASADPSSSGVPPSAAGVGLTPAVRLEVRPALGPPTVLDLPETGFLLGTVAGCDLRLAGAGLPPVVALLTRQPDGPYFRKLMPTQPVLLNGRSVSSGRLSDGDRLSIAGVEVRVHVEAVGPRLESSPRRPDPVHEAELARRREALDKDQAQYQTDVVRLHRRETELEEREHDLRRREEKLAQGREQLHQQSADVDARLQRLEAEETRLREQGEQAARQQTDVDRARTELAQRETGMDGQQAMLTALRTRLDQLREELRHEGQQLADQRTKVEAGEADLRQRLQHVQRLRAELEAESQAREEERKQFAERSAAMEEALAQFRQVQADLEVEEARLRDWARTLSAAADEQAEEASVLRARATQLAALQQRVTTDRQSSRERELALVQAEQVRESLQEQLRRRSEDLAGRQRELTEQSRLQSEHIAALEQQRAEVEHARHQNEEQFRQLRSELHQRTGALEQQQAELAARAETLHRQQERLRAVGRAMGRVRKAFRAERGAAAEADARRQAEWEAARQEALAFQEQMPELELRAKAAQERLAAAREQLREHLAEMHAYTRQAREALETLRGNVAAEAERVRQRETELDRAREEHRLAVAAFRQQLIEWQGQVADLKRTLAHDETRLERRAAKVEAKTREVDAVSAQVEQRSEQVAAQERLVAERHSEMRRHLDDMREWYRHKLRELAGTAPAAPRHILPLSDEVEPGDEKLGQLLRSLDLVDAETLAQLLGEARRQRRSLRQLLLAGGYLTLYQMALMEAGDLDRLVLGPVRVIDRLRTTAHETVYRVFDPRAGQEAILRHLSEDDAEDAIRPDEFRQRFAQAARVRHPNVAATLEVLELAGRPAVLQECLTGLPMTDWPLVLGGSGVCYRLLHQAGRGLHAAHEAGVLHGHLHAGQVRLTGEGMLKLCGFGEPPWLRTPPANNTEEDVAADLAALGRLAGTWTAAPRRKGALLAESLASVVERLTTENPELRYRHTGALLEDLERIGADVPDDGAAWRKLLRAVTADEEPDEELRQSA